MLRPFAVEPLLLDSDLRGLFVFHDHSCYNPPMVSQRVDMRFYLPDYTRSGGVLGTTEVTGDIIVRCKVCGVTGILPYNKRLTYQPVGIGVYSPDLSDLSDFEQAGTARLAWDAVRIAVLENGLTGIEFHPPVHFKLCTKKKGGAETLAACVNKWKYHVIHVTGRDGSIARTSGVKLVKQCTACGWEEWTQPKRGIFVEEKQWDVSDFFYVHEFGGVLMTQRAVDVFDHERFSNFRAIPAGEYRPPSW